MREIQQLSVIWIQITLILFGNRPNQISRARKPRIQFNPQDNRFRRFRV